MATAQMQLSMACENPKCKHALKIEVTYTVAKNVPAVSLQDGLHAAAVTLGYRRVHSPGATPQVFCAICTGPIACKRCGAPLDEGPCGCLGQPLLERFDVDRLIEEGQGDADRG